MMLLGADSKRAGPFREIPPNSLQDFRQQLGPAPRIESGGTIHLSVPIESPRKVRFGPSVPRQSFPL